MAKKKIMANIIEVKKVNKVYGEGENSVRVLKDVSLEIAQGDFVAIMGQSGSGKSTLMNILGCLDKPTSGTYTIDGNDTKDLDINALAKLRGEKIGFIFQRYNLMSTLSALENVCLPAIYEGVSSENRKKRANKILTNLGLEDKTKNLPTQLSGGQQQRVSIARALMNGGEVILADEPTGALDSKSGENVMQLLLELHQRGHTIILVTHDAKIASYAQRVIEIKDGEVIADTRNSALDVNTKEQLEKHTQSLFRYHIDQLIESFKMSLQAIYAHKLRSLLTMLGIIIGITSVISVVALGQGAQSQILENISTMGASTIDIRPGKSFGDRTARSIKTLIVADAHVLEQQSYIDSVSPISNSSGTILYNNNSSTATLMGVSDSYFSVKSRQVETGRFFTDEEVLYSSPVVVIDKTTYSEFFPNGENAIGEVFIFKGQPLTIIGIAAESSMDRSESLSMFSPYTMVMNRITGARNIDSISLKVADEANPTLAEQDLTRLLVSRHGVKDFYTVNFDSIRANMESASGTMQLLIAGIAAISLVVGGIGVMNIMLVSVTERTKEIGIRMAIGAKPYNIMQQFLIEAVLICILGGIIGVLLAYGLGQLVDRFVPSATMIFSTESVIIAMACSSIIGVIFGFMPARSAAHLNPIDALSRE